MSFTLRDAVDIFIVAYVIYRVINLMQGTRAITLVKGLAVIFASSVAARTLNLHTISWLLERTTTIVLVALPVVFYPELRRGLEQIGRGRLFIRLGKEAEDHTPAIEEIVEAATHLSAAKIGGLLVLERQIGLEEYVETGIALDALLSKELLINIFEPNSPLHDGAVIIAEGRLRSAASVLPLTDTDLGSHLGTRHRAAVGMSEQTDALVVVISEETGTISLAVGGRLRRYLNKARLQEQLSFYWQREGGKR
ncbi:MAG: TIGR00159 family protein [Firmicutes bacterium]|nr:TIGR00159 family protein [Bacillota bacterium]